MRVLLCVFLILCSVTSVNASWMGDSNKSTKPILAHLVSYELVKGFMTIRVLSSGCTGVHSFKVVADSKIDNRVKVLRLRPDNCRMKERPIELQYSIRHLGLDISRTINVLNNSGTNDLISSAVDSAN